MSRFIRSALFPILIVIILALAVEWFINSRNTSNAVAKRVYSRPALGTWWC